MNMILPASVSATPNGTTSMPNGTTRPQVRIVIVGHVDHGKSTLLGMIATRAEADVNVIALIGERGREVREFIEKDLGEAGRAKSVVVVATSAGGLAGSYGWKPAPLVGM